MQLHELLNHLHGVKPQSDGSYIALCPCHDDHRPSLDITQGQKGIVMNCPVCSANGESVMNALGLDVKELFYDNNNTARDDRRLKKPVTYYYSENLKKTRFYFWDKQKNGYSKGFCWYHRGANDRQVKGLPKDENGKSVLPPLYKQGSIKSANEYLETVYIVEGEKDVDTMTNELGLFAVCSPHGAGRGNLEKKWSGEYNKLFEGASVAVIPDNDDPGRELANYIASQILPYADEVKVLDLTREWVDLKKKGDITDVYESEKPSQDLSLAETVKFKLKALTMTTKPSTSKDLFYIEEKESGSESKEKSKNNYICLDDVESKETEWLWYPYIPQGKITLMTADPGTGKTFLSLYLAAQVSTGRPFYGEEGAPYKEPANVVYQTAEDGIADTIKPRLEPMRPDFSKIFILDETDKSLSLSDKRIEKIMIDLKPKLMIFDPLQAYLGAKVDMNRANEVRPILERLGKLAEKHGVAVILIMHHSKASQNSALHRALGSMDIPAVARSMLIMGKDPKNPFGRVLCHEKSSLAKRGRSVCFEVNFNEGGIKFNGFCDDTADEILNAKSDSRNRPSVKVDEAAEQILEWFGEDKYKEVESVKNLCNQLGCSQHTLYKAKKELGIKSVNKGYGKEKTAFWVLPDYEVDDIFPDTVS